MRKNDKHFQSLSEFLFEKIAENILSGKYAVGQKLVENDIMNEFSVSKSPVREALQVLINTGLVEYRARRGCYVKTIEVKDVVNHYVVRTAMEGVAARLAWQENAYEFIDELKTYYDMMKEAADKKDMRAYLDSHDMFHEFFAIKSKNDILMEFCKNLRMQSMRYRLQFLNMEIVYDLHTHDNLISHLEARNVTPDEYQKLMEIHIQEGLVKFKKYFKYANNEVSIPVH